MSMEITYQVALEIASHEAIVRQTYYDSKKVPTWSVGLTSATGHVVERYWKKPASLEHCLRVYVWALDNYAFEVREAFKGFTLTEAEFAAALSFHWNTGKIKVASWVKTFRAGNKTLARKQFMQYNKPAEIVGRRTAEAELLFEGKWSNKGTITEYTRVKENGQIDWSSARKINIEKPLRDAMQGKIPDADKVIVTETRTTEVPVEVPVEVTPPKAIEKADKAEASTRRGFKWVGSSFIGSGLTGGAVTTILGFPVSTVLTWLAVAVAGLAIWLLFGPWILRRIKAIQTELG